MILGYSLVQSAIHLALKPVPDRFTSSAILKGQPTFVINPIQTDNGGNLDLSQSSKLAEDGSSPTTQQLFSGNYAQSNGRIFRDEMINLREARLPIQTKELKSNYGLLEAENKIL